MRVLITGSHGLIGTELTSYLACQGYQLAKLVRHNPGPTDIAWDPDSGVIEKDRLDGFDAVVHLAGDNIASERWTDSKKAKIRTSRIKGTRLLCDSLATLTNPPSVIVSASAIGYYGDRADEYLSEESTAGSGFLAEVCRDWEAACGPARDAGIRVANLRIGVVLSPAGGALKKMLAPFQMGAGGRLGSGKQYMSWICIDDVTGAIHHVLTHEQLDGPINAVAPNPVSNNQFTAALGTALIRPTIVPVPGFAAHLLLGEMADALLLSSARVNPRKLLESGYKFRHPELLPMLREMLRAA